MRFRKWAFCSTVFSAVAVILFSISMGTEHWIDGIVYKGQNNDTAQIGFINFGLFRGEYSINFGLTDRQESFAVPTFFKDQWNMGQLWGTVVMTGLAVLLAVGVALFGAFNALALSRHKANGPLMIMILSLLSLLFGVVAFGIYVGLYHSDMDVILSKDLIDEFDFLKLSTKANFAYSFWLTVGATASIAVALAFSPLEKSDDRSDIQKAYLTNVQADTFLTRRNSRLPLEARGNLMLY
ncbi:clarin-2-like [Oscarella lobularis]|uniref:clarin-2-like n=1 Tax=Oscarella lobularis TaxID=121494 RepID=UPI0033140017